MTLMEMFAALSEGNPGGLTVCLDAIKHGADHFPTFPDAGRTFLRDLDAIGCYGSDIWVLYKDVCAQDLRDTMVLARAFASGNPPADLDPAKLPGMMARLQRAIAEADAAANPGPA